MVRSALGPCAALSAALCAALMSFVALAAQEPRAASPVEEPPSPPQEARPGAPERPASARPPDVLFVSLDTLRADALACYGNPRPTSPNIDALAARGVRFAHCYAPAPHTAPSHVSMLTGLLPVAHGVPNATAQSQRLLGLADEWPILGERLAAAGYQTTFVANQGQLRRDMGLARGIEQFDTNTNTFGGAIDVLERMLEDTDPDRPLFSFVHTYEPHAPYLPPRRMFERDFHGAFTDAEYRGVVHTRYEALLPRAREGTALAREFLAGAESFGPADVEYLVGLYHEDVLWTDAQFGRLLALWSRHRDLANTLVVLVSDHGEQLGERGAFGHRHGLEVELVHVPFVVAGPGVVPRVEDKVVSLAAVPAALLEHLRLPVPAHAVRGARFAVRAPRRPALEPGSEPGTESAAESGTGGAAEPAVEPAAEPAAEQRTGIAHLQDPIGPHASLGLVDGSLQFLRGIGRNEAGEWTRDLAVDPRGLALAAPTAERLDALRRLSLSRQQADVALRARHAPRVLEAPTRDQADLLRALGYTDGGDDDDETEDPGAPPRRDRQDPGPDDHR
jgi:arylsulfatase A-like enzyme